MASSSSLAALESSRKQRAVFLPEEVLTEILIRLPAKPLMRFKCVSKLWLSLIRSRYFTDRFLELSPSRPRFLAYLINTGKPSNYKWFTSSSGSVFNPDPTLPRMEGIVISAARGLVCFKIQKRVRVCNPHTRLVVELPIIEPESEVIRDNKYVWTYIGYNPVHDEYKVLRLACEFFSPSLGRVVKAEHHVLVLGAGASWRKIQCHILHTPSRSPDMTVNGVLYYKAYTYTQRCVLMSFDLISEEFNLTKFPMDEGKFWRRKLINYQGKLAFFDNIMDYCTNIMSAWVLEDAKKSRWSDKKTFVLPFSQMTMMMGATTTHSGQVWLQKVRPGTRNQPGSFWLINYDWERKEIIQSIEMGPLPGGINKTVDYPTTVLDDIENIMYLET